MLPGLAAGEAADRYATLQVKIKELEAELNNIKQDIIGYCQSQGMNRVFGNECQITYRLVEKATYDEYVVKGALEPLGLWEKVLSFDAALLKQLGANGVIPAATLKKLDSLKHTTSSYPQLWVKYNTAEENE
jgi:hypothetical protein